MLFQSLCTRRQTDLNPENNKMRLTVGSHSVPAFGVRMNLVSRGYSLNQKDSEAVIYSSHTKPRRSPTSLHLLRKHFAGMICSIVLVFTDVVRVTNAESSCQFWGHSPYDHLGSCPLAVPRSILSRPLGIVNSMVWPSN